MAPRASSSASRSRRACVVRLLSSGMRMLHHSPSLLTSALKYFVRTTAPYLHQFPWAASGQWGLPPTSGASRCPRSVRSPVAAAGARCTAPPGHSLAGSTTPGKGRPARKIHLPVASVSPTTPPCHPLQIETTPRRHWARYGGSCPATSYPEPETISSGVPGGIISSCAKSASCRRMQPCEIAAPVVPISASS